MTLRIIADDLTGALDAAAPFASADAPVRLVLEGAAAFLSDKITFSTESRNLDAAEATARSARAHVFLHTDGEAIWFKKVDSVLRGQPFAETLAIARAGEFRRCLFAPAFPEMGRITRGGTQLVKGLGDEWRQAGPDNLAEAFVALGASGIEIIVLDAETPCELRQAVAPFLNSPGLLWAGSGGLARAMVPERPLLRAPEVGIFILGTNHPVTRAQAALLVPHTIPALIPKVDIPAFKAPILIDPVPHCADARETAAAMVAAIACIEPPQADRALVVSGGDCLSMLLRETRAEGLDCIGEVGIGLPLSRIVGGRFADVPVISKSGGFGAETTLLDLASH